MKELTKYEKFKIYVEDAESPFSGWDFSYIRDRLVTEPLPWSYSSIIIPYLRTAKALFDMGTGGGEFLSSLQPLPKKTIASENYKPNFPIAKKRLEPLGVKVMSFEDDNKIPIESETFDVIINRHESYSCQEVYRILKKDGLFITQQVGAKNDLEVNQDLGLKIDNTTIDYLHWNLDYAVNELKEAGFSTDKEMECFPKSYCFDIGALVYYLNAIPWQVPNFSVERFRTKLKDIHLKIEDKGFFELTSHRFLIVARKS